ncbi:AraC family transcriptional regulator [Nevskia sp.]|uniref:AraC family transcriptional regulator n=1 Tax=Nevskia sp. TaxID=1929292 RepID=UPI0025CE4BEF|nr:AraC family transcriptional regulator [Nevskia sp.]
MLDRSAETAFAAVLGAHQLRAYISDNPHYCGSFAEPERACAHGMFHLIDEGSCVVDFARGAGSIDLNSGDLVMFPHGSAHTLRSPPDGNAGPAANRFTSILCGEFEFATGRRNPILDALPDWIVVREEESHQQFRHLARLMAHEARQESFGRQLVLDKLADALFVMALRHHIASATERRGLIAALIDPRMARVLEAMHAEPGRQWTVAMLAELAHQSRTAFAQHFNEVLGVSPYQYLTEWRMAEALRLLADPKSSAATIAEKLGYQTEAAFRRAFKKIHGYGPGRARRAARSAQIGAVPNEEAAKA